MSNQCAGCAGREESSGGCSRAGFDGNGDNRSVVIRTTLALTHLILLAPAVNAQTPAELHVFQTGGHGFLNFGGGADLFMERFADWMRANGWIKPVISGTGSLFR